MQNLLESELESAVSTTLGSEEMAWVMIGCSLGLFADLTATMMQITTAATIIMKSMGASEIRLSDIGRAG